MKQSIHVGNPLLQDRKTTTIGHMSDVINDPEVKQKVEASEELSDIHRMLVQYVKFFVLSCGECCMGNKVAREIHIPFVKLVGRLAAGKLAVKVPVYPK